MSKCRSREETLLQAIDSLRENSARLLQALMIYMRNENRPEQKFFPILETLIQTFGPNMEKAKIGLYSEWQHNCVFSEDQDLTRNIGKLLGYAAELNGISDLIKSTKKQLKSKDEQQIKRRNIVLDDAADRLEETKSNMQKDVNEITKAFLQLRISCLKAAITDIEKCINGMVSE